MQKEPTLEHAAISYESSFKDSAIQSVGSGTNSINDQFTGASSQTIHSGGAATGTTFSGNATQTLEDGAKSENTTFNDSASGIVGAQAQMLGTTTLNGTSTLAVIAPDAYPLFSTQQLNNVTLNDHSMMVLAPTGKQLHLVKADTLTLNGGTIAFGHDNGTEYTALLAGEVNGTGGTLIMNGDLVGGNDQLLTRSMTGNGAYNIILNNQDSGKDLPDDELSNLVVIDNIPDGSQPSFSLLTGADDVPGTLPGTPTQPGKKPTSVDQGTHKVTLVTTKDPVSGKTVVALVTDTSKTSYSADAVMGLASATQYIFDGEMQALRARRGDVQHTEQGDGGVWGRYLHNSSDIQAGAGADYRLAQNGMELGGDKVFDLADGNRLALGGLTSVSKSSVKQRGNSSQVSSYGVGLYATYLSSVGYYIDGVVKFNHFNNDLRTRTDRGQAVKGSYDQNGYGAALETGYRFTLGDGINLDPYVRATYFAAQGKDMELSNGMKAGIGTQKSAKGELGVSVGKAFAVHSMTLSPYVTAAVEHEFLKDNKVTFNDTYTYKNDLSGTLGKFGAGLSAQLTPTTQAYVEADYRKGDKVESPIMANAGFRVSF